MEIIKYGVKCHECNEITNNKYVCTCTYSHNACKICASIRGYGKNHIICLKCRIYCTDCHKQYCTPCGLFHRDITLKCNTCGQTSCNMNMCAQKCGILTCEQCVQNNRRKEFCTNCGKSWFNYALLNLKNGCYDCMEKQKPTCDICYIKKCDCYMNLKQFKYDKLNATQLLKICTDCENMNCNKLLFKSMYYLVVHTHNTPIYVKQNNNYKNNFNVIKTLLLVANNKCKNKYVNKYLMINIIIPYVIQYYVGENIYIDDGNMLYKCNRCFMFTTYVSADWENDRIISSCKHNKN